ncbi:MAG: hypothetical protein INF93_12815 [Rhodobacter sp.]|nr:hypothetical protein [Rhodobacter sp.]
MTDAPPFSSRGSAAAGGTKGLRREDRLKAALKANIARRKAQAKARQDDDHPDPGGADQAKDGSGPTDRQQDNA